MTHRFRNRDEAGRALAAMLAGYAGRPEMIVLGLPRGGVPVAAVVADALEAPLDVLVVRKLGVPGHEELAFGAIAGEGVQVLNRDIVRMFGISGRTVAEIATREGAELARRERAYREGRPSNPLQGKTAILVDDGIATGATMRAALRFLKQSRAARIVVAAPVIARDAWADLKREADEVVAVAVPESLGSVGEWYVDFTQTTDAEVRSRLARLRGPAGDGNFVAN